MIVRVSIRQDANPHAYYKCMICPHCKKDSRVLTDRNKEILLQLCNGAAQGTLGVDARGDVFIVKVPFTPTPNPPTGLNIVNVNGTAAIFG